MKVVTFNRNYGPYIKGETVELEDKTAQYFLNISAVVEGDAEDLDKPCADCGMNEDGSQRKNLISIDSVSSEGDAEDLNKKDSGNKKSKK